MSNYVNTAIKENYARFLLNFAWVKYQKHGTADLNLAIVDIHHWKIFQLIESISARLFKLII